MCGIFGLVVPENAGYSSAFLREALATLATCSQSRGKDSSGLVIRDPSELEFRIIKGPISLKYLFGRREVEQEIDRAVRAAASSNGSSGGLAIMGHTRLVTNGSQTTEVNNQPVVKDGVIGIHNGIIVNVDELWARHLDVARSCDVDTEVLLALVRKYLRAHCDLPTAISRAINETRGTVSAAFFVDDVDAFAVATNNGSLYTLTNSDNLFAFASEECFLSTLARKAALKRGWELGQVRPGSGVVLDLKKFEIQRFTFESAAGEPAFYPNGGRPYRIAATSITDGKPQQELVFDPARIAVNGKASVESKLLEYNIDRIRAMRRCTKCILPDTFPFIEFDAAGVCNYCRTYRIKNNPKPLEQLETLVAPYRRPNGHVDCVIPFSGGRDSTLTLHIAKKLLGLNPVTYTYDWGMVTDLARRNIARVCGKLGVENILVSADIAWKRANIRKNVTAWLRRPHLGMVPLFMAGDKSFYYYCDQVKKQTGLQLNIWGINTLENTDFKVGFLGVPPDPHKKFNYSLSAKRQMRLYAGIATNVLLNPGYINQSVWDSVVAYSARILAEHRDYYHMFDYYRWDEGEIDRLVLEEYEWEKAIDTPTTWRIGDGTAPFYNYIYYTVAGFSEYDTFRSNQIREGMLTRERALELVEIENVPRYPSIKWYMEIIGVDYDAAICRVNQMPKLYA